MNILITGSWASNKKTIDALEKMGHKLFFMPSESGGMPLPYKEVEGAICNGLFLYHDIKKFENLKYIQLISAGFDRVPMDYVREKDIAIFNARGVYSIPMAEYALAGVLSLYKNMTFFMENQKNHKWIKNRGLMEAYGKKVLIVGCGNVGNECAKRFFALGMKVSGADIANPNWNYGGEFYFMENIEAALKTADVVVLTLPLTDATYHLFNEKLLGCLKETAVLVNISRGAVIDNEALYKVISGGKIMGAVLDVFEEEPLSEESPLWDMKNVIITPHNSFEGEKNSERLKSIIIKNLESREEI